MQSRFQGVTASERLKGGDICSSLSPKAASLLPTAAMPGHGWDHPPHPLGVLAQLLPAVSTGSERASRPSGRHCAPRRSCRCQSSRCAARDNASGGGRCACPAASTGPTVGPWSQDAGICCRGGGSRNPKRAGTPGCRRPGPPTGQQEMGYHPAVAFPVGLSSWQPLPLLSAPIWPRVAGPLHPSCIVLAELGSSPESAKASGAQAGCRGNEVLRGLGAPGTSKRVAEDVKRDNRW